MKKRICSAAAVLMMFLSSASVAYADVAYEPDYGGFLSGANLLIVLALGGMLVLAAILIAILVIVKLVKKK